MQGIRHHGDGRDASDLTQPRPPFDDDAAGIQDTVDPMGTVVESMITDERRRLELRLTWRRRKGRLTTHVTKHRTSPKTEEFSQNFSEKFFL